jgi:hypothetical protein
MAPAQTTSQLQLATPGPLVLGRATSTITTADRELKNFLGLPIAQADDGLVPLPHKQVFSFAFLLSLITLIGMFVTGMYLLILYRNQQDLDY